MYCINYCCTVIIGTEGFQFEGRSKIHNISYEGNLLDGNAYKVTLTEIQNGTPGRMNSPIHFQNITVPCRGSSQTIRYVDRGQGKPILFLHGWATGLYTFLPLMELLANQYRLIALDFPGFGESEIPGDVWGTADYAECTLAFAKSLAIDNAVVVSHSFGGRVSMRMALIEPSLIKGMVLIAAAGIKRPRPFWKKARIQTIQTLAKTARAVLPAFLGKPVQQSLYSLIASVDYQQAGEMRKIFVRVVNEDMKDVLPQIKTPSLLIYGSEDEMTPPVVGKMIQDGLPDSRYIELPGFDHNSILDRGRHQVCHQIVNWLKEL